jgi:glycosyltransferase involved in cell wall biosynthesis
MDELGQKAYQYVKEKRNWEAITDYYIQLYKSLIKGYSIPINVVD